MKQLLRICLTGAFFLLFEGLLSPMLADNGKSDKEILVLNSINFNLPWARNFYWYVHDVLQEQGITARAESLSVPALQDTMEVNAVIEHLRQKYPLPPAAIVIIGDPGWIVCRPLFDDLWKDVPVIITNSRDRLPATLEVLLSHAPLNETNSVPAQEWRKGYNLTTLKQHYYVKETVELIYSLIPDMDRLAFISDDRYISEETRGDVKEAVEKHFPNLPLELLSTTHLSTEMLLDTLRSYKANTGIIYYSWFESHNKEDNNYLFDHIQEIITNFTSSPLFLLSSEDLSNYVPSFDWEKAPASQKQIEYLQAHGIFADEVANAGLASLLINRLKERQGLHLSTPKQIRFLERKGFIHVGTWSFAAASSMIEQISENGWHIPDGIIPATYNPEKGIEA